MEMSSWPPVSCSTRCLLPLRLVLYYSFGYGLGINQGDGTAPRACCDIAYGVSIAPRYLALFLFRVQYQKIIQQ